MVTRNSDVHGKGTQRFDDKDVVTARGGEGAHYRGECQGGQQLPNDVRVQVASAKQAQRHTADGQNNEREQNTNACSPSSAVRVSVSDI